MAGMFSYESSEVDWCEDNYKLSKNVVEYFNMMSSFTFFVISPIMLYLLHPYAMERYLALLLVWFMMIFVANAYTLNCFAIHILYSLFVELRSCADQRVL
ncbi:alkaline ceramidase 1-like isoform X2 [Xyrauchen texanus]|uniref:alkaline ceramidase 1-like isoform X2 n=1 Tax=Xyrauchen texanus TaxID=154827 RepID=UPI00224227F0|nr:alkaline ceramidase 1-like isoform X2 [Xyrauchen texanus]